MSILSIKNISKFYTLDGKHQEQALKNINLQISSDLITAIYGPSGCGKTSLLNIISGLDRQYEGVLEFKGESLRDLSEIELTQFRKDKIGFVFQNFNLIPHQSVLDNVKLPLYVKDLSDREMTMIAKEQLSNLGMEPFITKNVKQLSGGQKQRVAIARALVNQPDMIVADEPTGSLDSQSQEMVLEVFKKLAQTGKTVLIVTHNPEVAEYADVIIKMKDGEIVEEVKK
ncbi:ABC transporter ATP-binding protein [Streptococcus pseudopneumoniae]|uniref:ABC transporter ATP-binding protein n=1 Tax=Streptococcus pseudopneumoniae TaxID=257758 RepID=UPI00110C384E|nr:ABC transporter ATP-binding protein [Streptococcus pseudopneumoniae]TMR54389.1 ABC transporter ATP-binding protein [Streptococcus pseudopneumoniae]